jgi:tetratricopeptide (TPR) repeat protein
MTADTLQSADAAKLEAACARGMELQLLGQLDLAGQIYRAIFQVAPQHPAANYCFGMLQVQARRPLEALPYLKTALLTELHIPDYWLGYLEALLLAGRTDAARNILGLARQQGLAGPAFEAFSSRLDALAPSQASSPAGVATAPQSADPRPFIVLAPAFSAHSAGIRVMHTLCNELNAGGRTAYLVFYRFRPDGTGIDVYVPDSDSEYCKRHTSIPRLPACSDVGPLRDLIDAAYVIYPEVVAGNPLNARRVVRYVLNSPAANGYAMGQDQDDYIVAFSRLFWPNPHAIVTLVFEDPLFNDENSRPAPERTMDCTYIGKGAAFGDCFKLPGSVLIERRWPADKESLSIMLRNTRFFYTWDLISQTNVDALFCGAIPVVARWSPFSPAVFDSDFGPFPYAEATIQNGVIAVAHVPELFDERRRRYLDSYRAAACAGPRTVGKMAADIERYFQNAGDAGDAGISGVLGVPGVPGVPGVASAADGGAVSRRFA